MVCERPPACRFAPRLSPFVRGTLAEVNRRVVSPLRRGTAAERSDRQGVAHTPCCWAQRLHCSGPWPSSHKAHHHQFNSATSPNPPALPLRITPAPSEKNICLKHSARVSPSSTTTE